MENLQVTFNAGEITPVLFGRVDLPKYVAGLKVCQNYIVMSHGGVTRRPGQPYIGFTRDETKESRLIPFIYSIAQAYSLEFGEFYMKVIKDGAYVTESSNAITGITNGAIAVITSNGHGYSNGDEIVIDNTVLGMPEVNGRQFVVQNVTTNTYELEGVDSTNYGVYTSGGIGSKVYVLTTTYQSSDLPLLKLTQSADIMTLNVRGTVHPMRELTRSDHHVWALTDVVFSPALDGPGNQAGSAGAGAVEHKYKITALQSETEEESLPGLSGTALTIAGITQANPAVVTLGAPHTLSNGDEVYIEGVVGMTEVNGERFIVDGSATPSFALKGIDSTGYGAYVSDGSVKETFVKIVSADPSTSNKHVLTWNEIVGAFRYNIYKEENGLYGYIGSSELLTFSYDGALVPDLFDAPPKLRDPFVDGDNAGVSAYFEQRRVMAGTEGKPNTVFMTQTGNPKNLGVSFPLKESDAVTFPLESAEVNEIRHIVPLEDLIILAADSEWKISGGAEAITAKNVRARKQGKIGASHVPPLVIGGSILFVQNRGSYVRDMSYGFEGDRYESSDLSLLAAHLFENRSIKEWAYSQVPLNVIWCIMTDGALLGLTYIKEHQVWGWHRHETDGYYESVCTIPEGDEDVTYVIVKRTINGSTRRYVEKIDYDILSDDDPEDAFFIDCGKSVSNTPEYIEGATQANPVVITITGHSYTDGDIIRISHVDKDEDTGEGTIELNKQYFKVSNSAANSFELQTVDGTDIDGTDHGVYVSGGEVRLAFNEVSGLEHLEGETVSILGDGSVIPDKVVSNGKVTLGESLTEVHVGLRYVSRVETLNLGLVGGANTIGRQKDVSQLSIKFHQSRGGYVNIASNKDELKVELAQREEQDYGSPINLISGDNTITPPSGWDKEGSIVFEQTDPLPSTILSITKEFSSGGR